MILLIPNNKNISDIRKDLHCKHSSNANFEIGNELIGSYEEKNNDVRKDLQCKQQICIAMQTFPIPPLAPLDPRKNHYFFFDQFSSHNFCEQVNCPVHPEKYEKYENGQKWMPNHPCNE